MTVSSRHNKNITPDQLRLMLKDIPEDEHQRYIDAMRPEGRGNYFNKPKIYACEDGNYGDFIVHGVENGIEGFGLEKTYGCGVTYFTVPCTPGGLYMLLGDPGTGNPPNRNSPCLQVWNVTDFPKYKATLAAFWWGRGDGSITPFIVQLLRFMQFYNPVYTGVDSTGTQKNTAELLNLYINSNRTDPEKFHSWLGDIDLSRVTNPGIYGMDFSVGRKAAYLVAGRLMIEAGLMIWPKFVTGMRSQLTNYDPEKDRAQKPKIAQDLVATYCMAAWQVRFQFSVDLQNPTAETDAEDPDIRNQIIGREARLPRDDREYASSRI